MIPASSYPVIFKLDHKIVYKTSAFLGCIRSGHPRDTMTLYEQAAENLAAAIAEGALKDGRWNSVIISLWNGLPVSYTAEEINAYIKLKEAYSS